MSSAFSHGELHQIIFTLEALGTQVNCCRDLDSCREFHEFKRQEVAKKGKKQREDQVNELKSFSESLKVRPSFKLPEIFCSPSAPFFVKSVNGWGRAWFGLRTLEIRGRRFSPVAWLHFRRRSWSLAHLGRQVNPVFI